MTGPLAARLWQIDQAIGALQSERQEVLYWLRASGSAGPLAVSHPQSAVSGLPTEDPGTPADPGPRWSGQQVLLSVGALLVLVAATVFVAVTWTAIGVAGQVGVMAFATLLAGTASVRLSQRGLRSTAAALAVLTVGLAVVDAWAAYTLNLAGVQQLRDSTYVTFAAAVLAVACAVASWADLRIRPFPWASVMAAATVPAAGLDATRAGDAVTAGVALLVAVAFAVLRRALPVPWRTYRLPLLLAAGGYLAWSWSVAIPTIFDEPLPGQGGWCAAVTLLASAGCATLARLDRGFRAMDLHPILAVAAVPSAAVAVVGVAHHARPVALVVLAVAAAAASAYVLFPHRPLVSHPWAFLAAGAQVAAVGAALDLADYANLDGVVPRPAPLSVAMAAMATSAAVIAGRQRGLRTAAAAYAVGVGIGAVAVPAYPHGERWTAGALVAGAVVAAVLAGWRRSRPEEVALAAVALLAAVGAVGFAGDAGARPLAVVLALCGLTALAYGVLPSRGYVAILGVLGCSASTWTLFLEADVDTVEAYSLPLAALAALVGLVRLHRDPQAPSWLTVGPALTAALLPSALRSIDDEAFTRPLLVLLAGALVLVGGVLLRWQSPVVVGAVALGLVAISQLVIYAVGLPRWLSFGTVGLALLVVGARYEQRRRNARQAASWVAALR